MPRYEFGSSKFWEIELAAKSFTCRFGKLGANGQTTLKTFGSAAEAKAAYDKLIAEKTKKGYELAGKPAKSAKTVKAALSKTAKSAPVAAKASHARDPKLEAAIQADPDDADAYLVYADWLQAQGDPRGELVVLQHANKAKPAARLIDQHREHFYGKLAEFTDCLQAYPYRPLGRTSTWRWGYLETAWISNKFDRSSDYGGEKPSLDIDEALGWLLDHPSARFLRELTVGIVSFGGDNDYAGVAKAIGKRSLPTLRKLILGDFYSEETELNWSDAGNLEPLYKAVPNLESLTVRSGSMRLGKLVLPKLRELNIISGGLDKGSLASICAARWPVLERLNVQLGQEQGIKAKHVQPIFDAKAFPKVRHLGLGNSDIADEVCAGLASSKIAAQLVSLDLSKGRMGDAGATALAAGKFPRLETLDVSQNFLTKKGVAALKPIAKQVIARSQEDDGGDPDNRYIAGYE